MKNKLSINSSKISRSSCEVFEDAQFSPTKMAKRFHSPTDLIKRERQARMSEKKLPFFKLNLESSNNPNGSCASSWSSFTSFEDKNLEFSPLSKLNPTQISNNIIKNSMEIPNLDLEPNDQKNVILQAHIKTPSNFMYQSKSKDTITIPKLNFEKKGSFDLIEPIIEEGSPLAKILRKKKQQDKLSNVLAQNEKDKNVLVNFKEISTNSENLINGHIFRHLIFAPKVNENLFKQHLLITYKGIVYANKLSQPSEKFLEERGILLPEKKNNNKKTLFLDLDETLIHSCHLMESPEVVLEIKDKEIIKKLGFNIRPYCSKFIEKASRLYEIFVFTASSEIYAENIIAKIDPNNKIQQIFNKNSTMNTKNGFVIKDLRIFQNRNLKDMIIVDNLSHSFSFQIDNGIPLLEWQSDKTDLELKYLYKYLKKAYFYDDVRDLNKIFLKLRQLGELNFEDLAL